MKKQIISLVLLFLLLAPAVVTYTWIQHRKHALKKEVKWKMIAGIDKKELVLLKFSKTEIDTKLKWEHAKEFEFNHEMYDVVDKQVSKDSISYWCWWDFEETQLNKRLNHLLVDVYQHDSKSKEKQELLHNFYKSIYFQPVLEWLPIVAEKISVKTLSCTTFYQSKTLKTPSPPPNICS